MRRSRSPVIMRRADVTDHLANLVAKSLVVADLRGDLPYYRLLDTTRAYALEKLHGSGEYPERRPPPREILSRLLCPG